MRDVERDPPSFLILTNRTLSGTLRAVAGRERAVLYTTFMLFPMIVNKTFQPVRVETHQGIIDMVKNQLYYLNRARLLRRHMLVTADERTWRLMFNRGLTIYLDRTFPRRGGYDGGNTEPLVHKYWFGLRLVEAGFKALYLDYDAVVLGDVMPPFSLPYDIQGLSAWRDPELPRMGESLERTCGLYVAVIDLRTPLGSMIREYAAVMPGNLSYISGKTPNASLPCQSTGVMYLQPSSTTSHFLSAMLHRITEQAPFQWEGTAFNEVVMHFLWGIGDQAPLRYRLLPVDMFSNLGVYRKRKQQGLVVDPVILHAGGFAGFWKQVAWKEELLWTPQYLPPPPLDYGSSGLATVAAVVVLLAAAVAFSRWRGRRGARRKA
eukprot:scaffold27.g6017.t1